VSGHAYIGTSGFAYPAWAPRFYPRAARGDALLPFYATRLAAVELNGTFYRQPSADQVMAWVAAVPESFRFAVKAQRGGAVRALLREPGETLAWLLPPYRAFGHRMGTVLFRVPEQIAPDGAALDRLLRSWPPDLPLTLEFQHPSWEDDVFHARLVAAGASLCVTDLPDRPDPPTIRLTGAFLYLRLRRHDYGGPELDAWAARLEPFLAAGTDAFVFFRHDPLGRGAELALELAARLPGGEG
jgi:uncharacterized protein YecE (DUF72 family)